MGESNQSGLRQLEALIGLESAKEAIVQIIERLTREHCYRAQGIGVLSARRHLVFRGPPGVGKTRVARHFGQICSHLGALAHGHVVIVDQTDLTAGPNNKVALMRDKCDAALDGILYIKNDAFLTAGILRSTGDLKRDAVDVLIDYMQTHRERLIVILDVRTHQFDCISFHSGLARHFNETIEFEAYSAVDLMRILASMATRLGLALPDGLECDLFPWIVTHAHRSDWRNAREISDLFSKAIGARALRNARLRCGVFDGLDRNDFRQALATMRPDVSVDPMQWPDLYDGPQSPLITSHDASLRDSEA
jgi:stage V sporulation protein K